MSSLIVKNPWGTANGGLDQQRADLFYISMSLPSVLGGVSAWSDNIQVAVTKFPFPARDREMIATKYLNQTNFQMGAETAMGSIEIPVRYAIGHQAAVLLEQWHWMHSHPSGGVGLTTAVKTNGYFYWLIPNLTGAPGDASAAQANVLELGGAYVLEGVMIKGLKPTDANMESNNELVSVNLTLQIDRYYPASPSDLAQIATVPSSTT